MQNPIINRKNITFYKTGGFLAFILGFLSLIVTLLPIIIGEKGYFIYYGDYNAQQMPFYHLAAEAVKSGSFGWSWTTDLGANFIGSYAFYLIGSPFFWITALLPSSWIIHLMPFVLAVKHGIAALTAYAYIKRFVKSREAAVIGGLLYAFSGFQIFNIFFNHFQDVTAFFPLMLISMEELVCKNKKGLFALTIALMAAVNYFFFTGEAVFLILYFVVRCFSKDFPANAKKFFLLLFEAIIGVMLACVILLPAALAILSNYRINERLYGLDMVLYSDKTRLMRIIESFFMIPDVPARPNLFAEGSEKWASIGGYLPLFSMTGVIAFLKHRDGHWAKRLVIICMICAFIPILNCSFYMFNGSYYARWFFMPILIMALMTAIVIGSDKEETIPLKEGIWITAAVTAAFGIIAVLPVKKGDGISFFSLPKYPLHFWIIFAIAAASIAAMIFIAKKRLSRKLSLKCVLSLTVTACIVCTASVVYFGALNRDDALKYIDHAIDNEDDVTISVSDDDFFRLDVSEHMDNYPMLWDIPNMRCFHSVVPGSIMEFYEAVGIGRDVASRPDTDHFALRGLFSVKYYFDEINDKNSDEYESPLTGFEFMEDQNGFHVYKNKYFIPMGFMFDNYISRSEWETMSETNRTSVLIRAIVLEDDTAEKYDGILKKLSASERFVSKAAYREECILRKNNSASIFKYDSYGFTAEITSDKENLVFFSVPFDDGFTAKVNGIETGIERVDAGFMAVPVKPGKNTIEFEYETPGLKTGALITLSGAVIFIIYIGANHIVSRKKNKK
ncbi:MAG: YfhO family protein [Ruminococcus sp.]|nr:YfhO family protein [Ruminococcus sp.]